MFDFIFSIGICVYEYIALWLVFPPLLVCKVVCWKKNLLLFYVSNFVSRLVWFEVINNQSIAYFFIYIFILGAILYCCYVRLNVYDMRAFVQKRKIYGATSMCTHAHTTTPRNASFVSVQMHAYLRTYMLAKYKIAPRYINI